MTNDEIAEIVAEASKIGLDYPELSIPEAIKRAKEVLGYVKTSNSW